MIIYKTRSKTWKPYWNDTDRIRGVSWEQV